jgi:hypothetical protein
MIGECANGSLWCKALRAAKVNDGDHQHVGRPTHDDVAWRTHVTLPFVGHGNICKSQRTVMTL